MSKNLQQEIYGFVTELPEWQKILAAQLLGLNKHELTREKAIEASLQALLFENKLITGEPPKIEITDPSSETNDVPCASPSCKLVAITEVQNLNALSSSQKFTVASNGLTVVYGENGVGKSGYGRLFNSAFYSRGDNFLIGNVFGPSKNEPATALFEIISDDGVTHKLKYPEDKANQFFKQFAAFDSKSVNVHIDSQNELHVQPSELDFFENLIRLIRSVSEQLEDLVRQKKKENLFGKSFVEESSMKTAVLQISSKTDLAKLEAAAKWSDENEKRLNELEAQKTALSISELEKTKSRLGSIKTKLAALKAAYAQVESALSDEKVDFIAKAITRYDDLKVEVARTGVEQFHDPKFKGIGSELWQQFIKAGYDLNSLHHDEHPNFPSADDPCPYCRQNLPDQAVELIKKYSAFLESTARDSMKKAHDWGVKSLKDVEALQVPTLPTGEQLSEWVASSKPEALQSIVENLEAMKSAKESTTSSLKTWDKALLKRMSLKAIDFDGLEALLVTDIQNLNEEKAKAQLKIVNDELVVLQHKKVLGQLLSEIKIFVSDLVYVDALEKLIRQIARTTNITNKATELNEKYISNRYVQHFKQECIDLNIPCPDLNPVGAKGKTKRKYSIVGELPSKVLSEGEQRAVALADFFTEAQISEMSGLIFDDPVNSQDHNRKGKIAHRLAVESKSRQVIVLTHDLLFLNDLAGAASDVGSELTCHWMAKNNPTETGIIYANTVPDIEKAFIDAKLAKDRLIEAKQAANPLDGYRSTKDGLGALRASYEAFIVRIVFDGIVERFSRRVRQTDVHKVHAPKESLYFISQKLAELSGYITGHLQFDPSTTEIKPELLEKEISIYERFGIEFKKEKKEALKTFSAKVEDGSAQPINFN